MTFQPLHLPPVRHPSPPARGLWLAGLISALSGCASLGPTPSAPVSPSLAASLDTRYSAVAPVASSAPGQAPQDQRAPLAQPASAEDDARLARWWTEWRDPHLSALVQQALARNTDLRVAQANLRAAQAARAAVEAGSRPQLGAQLSSSRSRAGGQSTGSQQLGFSASWEPDLWGSQAAGLEAAEADVRASQANLASIRMALVAEVALAQVQWQDAQAREALTRSSLTRLQQTAQLTHWRVAAGLASGLDEQQARLSVAQAEASLPALATERDQQLHQLALLTGRAPAEMAALLPRSVTVSELSPTLAPLALGVPADLLRRRPDVRAAEAAWQAQWAQREQTRREGLPSLSLSGSLGLQAASLSALGSGGAGVAALAAGLGIELIDGGQRRALVDQQSAALDAGQAAYAGAVLAALKDVEDSLVALRASRESEQALAQAAQAAEQVRQLSAHRQASGLVDLRTLLQAERDALAAQTSLQSGRSALALNLVRLFKALGGGWAEADLAEMQPAQQPTLQQPTTQQPTTQQGSRPSPQPSSQAPSQTTAGRLPSLTSSAL